MGIGCEVAMIDHPNSLDPNQLESHRGLPYGTIYIISNKENSGFAEGNNIGIEYAHILGKFDYYLILNNDTVVDKSFLDGLVGATLKYPNAVLVGPKSFHFDERNRLGCTGGSVNRWTGQSGHDHAGEIDKGQFESIEVRDFISGTCILVRSDFADESKFFDSRFFFGGGEDVDAGLRAKERGFDVVATPDAKIWHKGESREGLVIDKNRLMLYSYYTMANRMRLINKHWHGIRKVVAISWLPISLFKSAFSAVLNCKGLRLGDLYQMSSMVAKGIVSGKY
jgi:GT2 family glycosyltransferase